MIYVEILLDNFASTITSSNFPFLVLKKRTYTTLSKYTCTSLKSHFNIISGHFTDKKDSITLYFIDDFTIEYFFLSPYTMSIYLP